MQDAQTLQQFLNDPIGFQANLPAIKAEWNGIFNRIEQDRFGLVCELADHYHGLTEVQLTRSELESQVANLSDDERCLFEIITALNHQQFCQLLGIRPQ